MRAARAGVQDRVAGRSRIARRSGSRRGVAGAGTVALLVLALCGGSCGGGSSVAPPAQATFLFGMRGIPDADGQFAAVTSDPRVLAKLESQLSLPIADRGLHIDGPIAPGNGGHNLSWSWHFVPDQWDVVEASVERCDGTPRAVESDVSAWVKDVGTFCPWNSYVQRRL